MCDRAGWAGDSRGRARPRISWGVLRAGALLTNDPQPRRVALGTLIDGELHLGHGFDAARYAFAAPVGLDPNAPHVRLDLAIAVGAHAAARAVAQGLRTVHRAGHAG